MVVHCIEFGTLWREKGKFSPDGKLIREESCVFNTTGFEKPGTTRKHYYSKVMGEVRINLRYFPWVKGPDHFEHCLVASEKLSTFEGRNRLLILNPVASDTPPDAFLTVVRSQTHGSIHFKDPRWRNSGVSIVARSEKNRKMQETLLLIEPTGQIFTERGGWRIQWSRTLRGILKPRLAFDLSLLPEAPNPAEPKTEIFTLLEGSGHLKSVRVDVDGEPIGEIERQELRPGSVILIEPYVAHTFYLTAGAQMHCFSSTPFDKSDFIPTPYL